MILVLLWGYAHTPSLAWLSPFSLSICVQRHTEMHRMCFCLVWECGTAIQGLKQLPWWSLIRVSSSLVIKLLSKHWRLTFTACRIVAVAFWGLIISEFCRRHPGHYSGYFTRDESSFEQWLHLITQETLILCCFWHLSGCTIDIPRGSPPCSQGDMESAMSTYVWFKMSAERERRKAVEEQENVENVQSM